MPVNTSFAQTLMDAILHKQWPLTVALVVIALVAGIRWLAPQVHDKIGAAVTSDRGGAILALIVGEATVIARSLAAGQPLTLALLLSGLSTGALGVGVYTAAKRIARPTDRKSTPPLEVPKAPGASAVTPALIVMFFAATLSACAWGACVLGQLSAAKQPLIEEVSVDLASADYAGLLAQLVLTAGDAVVTCTVQAVQAYEQSKQAKVDGGTALAAMAPSAVLTHAQAWLASHKKVACEPRHAS
jgi:hypothetical protein